MLVDSATITVRSGKGGAGMVSFRREKFVPKGGPDGGSGGEGGSVVVVGSTEVQTLLDFASRHHWLAQNGKPGQTKNCTGKAGQDLEINLPPGTQVFDAVSGEPLADLDQPGKRHVIAEGGLGGRGNKSFATATNQAPRYAEPGGEGQSYDLRLELKLIADIGLVGKPNAGKSTLLARISHARPKVAGYPFTTLEPNLGIAQIAGASSAEASATKPGGWTNTEAANFRDRSEVTPGGGDDDTPGRQSRVRSVNGDVMRRLVIADIPGLIDHAHTGAGLGVRFLRHIERTKVLVHVLELEPTDASDPIENYHMVRRELEAYSPHLAQKPELIALNKIELAGEQADRATAVQLIESELGQRVWPISGVTGTGLDALLQASAARID